MQDQLGDRFERLEAVVGTSVPERLAHQFSSPGKLMPGEIGCYASHLLAAEQIIVRGLPYAIIMEDDVELAPDFLEVSEQAASACSAGWDVISLCGFKIDKGVHAGVAKIGTREFVRFLRPPKATAAYILSYSGALKLLSPRRRCRPVDVDIHYSIDIAFDGYGLLPPEGICINHHGTQKPISLANRSASISFWPVSRGSALFFCGIQGALGLIVVEPPTLSGGQAFG